MKFFFKTLFGAFARLIFYPYFKIHDLAKQNAELESYPYLPDLPAYKIKKISKIGLVIRGIFFSLALAAMGAFKAYAIGLENWKDPVVFDAMVKNAINYGIIGLVCWFLGFGILTLMKKAYRIPKKIVPGNEYVTIDRSILPKEKK